MGVPQFYLNALSKSRLDVFEFVLSLNWYVEARDAGAMVSNPAPLPVKVHPGLSPDIGDVVWHYVNVLRGKAGFMQEVDDMMKGLLWEQSTDIPRTRNEVLLVANQHILAPTANPVSYEDSESDLDFTYYLLNFVSKFGANQDLSGAKKAYFEHLKTSVSSPAILKVREYLDRYAVYCDMKDPKSYLKFLASVCTLLSKVAHSAANDSLFQVLGEAENVIYKYSSTFPGYTKLDDAAKCEKSNILANIRARNG